MMASPPGLSYCGVTLTGQCPSPRDAVFHRVPTRNHGVGGEIISTNRVLRKSYNFLKCRRCHYRSEKARVILFGGKLDLDSRSVKT